MSFQRMLSLFFSAAILVVVFIFLALSSKLNKPSKDEIEVTNLPMSAVNVKPPVVVEVKSVSMADAESGVEGLLAMPVEVPLEPFGDLSESFDLQLPSFDVQLDEGLIVANALASADFDVTDVSQLDEVPRLLTPVQIRVPKQLAKQLATEKIEVVLIKLNVLIDDYGSVKLLSINQNPFPMLNEQVKALIKRTRFTVPLKDGKKVMSQFIWPIEVSV